MQRHELEVNDSQDVEDKSSDEALDNMLEEASIQIQNNIGIVQQANGRAPAPQEKPDSNLPSGPEVLLISGDPIEDPREERQFVDQARGELPKGPVEVQANLDPETEKAPLISSPDQPAKKKVIEAEPVDHLTLEEKGDSLPEIIHIPFEDAIKDDVLQGWEDSWVSDATYDAKTWGKLDEIKIDFVYLCKS